MFCMNCGNKLEEGSKFCTACGKSVIGINDVKVEQEASLVGSNTNGKRKMPRGFIVFGVVIIGTIILLTNVHTCDWCHKTYVGAQYYDVWDTNELMCKDCAMEYYMGPGYKNYKK